MIEPIVENGSEIYIEAPCGELALRDAFALGLGLPLDRVGLIQGGEMPPPLGTYDAFLEFWLLVGGYRTRTSLFLISDAAEAAASDAVALGQALAETFRCAVCIQPSGDPDPYKFVRFRPGVPRDLVTVDLDGLEDENTITVRPYFNVLAWPDGDA